jgi:carbamoyl-phosphate synthase large subunit
VLYIKEAIKRAKSIDEIYKLTRIDPWFLENMRQIVELEEQIKSELKLDREKSSLDLFKKAKEFGFSDVQLARLLNQTEDVIRKWRQGLGMKPDYKLVDTCAAEFQAHTPYYYSTYES